jgi:C1A family cysteine protease
MFYKNIAQGRRSLFLTLAFFFLPVFNATVQANDIELNELKAKIQKQDARWVAGETSISQLPPIERQKHVRLNKGVRFLEGRMLHVVPPGPLAALPASLDYRDNGFVTSIKNQGLCGGCWAFASAATLESQIAMSAPGTPDLAEQILLSCSGAGNCGSGGPIDGPTGNYLKTTGLPPESYFPYTATDNICSNAGAGWQNNTYKISQWQDVTTAIVTVDGLKNALVTYGPLATAMEVYEDFYNYTNGVYAYVAGADQGGHAIELIGYDDNDQAFIAKNSWGTGWGESGFFKIAYSQVLNVVGFGQTTVAYTYGSNPTPTPNPSSRCNYVLDPTIMAFVIRCRVQ